LSENGKECGHQTQRKGRIVGGEVTYEKEFPWVVSIQSKSTHFCGGFAVSQSLIVSAAHCFQNTNRFLQFHDGWVSLNNTKSGWVHTLIW